MNLRKSHNEKLILPILIFLAGGLVLTAVLYNSGFVEDASEQNEENKRKS